MNRNSGLLFRIKSTLLRLIIKAYIQGALIHRASANAFFSVCRWGINSPIDIMALPLIWMDESTANEKGLLRQGLKGIAYGPHYIGQVQSTESVSLPDIHYYVFERARVSVSSSSVILDDKQVIIDRAIAPDQDKFNYAGGLAQAIAHNGNTAVVRLGKSENIKKGVFLGGNGSFNYYHWMVEILAKLELLSKLPEHYQKYPLLVSEDVVRIPSFKVTLDLFARGHEKIVLSKELSYVVDELIYINSPSNLPFNLVANQKFKCTYVTIDSLSIDYLRKIALQEALKTPTHLNYPKKIFLCRKSGLRNYNQDEVFSYLSEFGFTKIFMEDLSFLEQVRTVHHADSVVGPTGAAWTNLIFCKSGAKALCWMADEFGDFSAYSSIAGIVGVDLRYLTYKASVHSTGELYYKDYYIDIGMIEKGLSALGEQACQPCDHA
jgi:capsular polysaccharide biosynthesis protein